MFPDAYKRVLGAHGVKQPLAGTLIGRLSIAAEPLSMVLLVKGSTGSFAAAGLVIAAYSIAAAVSLPVQGRVMDRVGQPPVIAAAALVNATAFLALIGGAEAGAPIVALAALATVAGLGTLPTGNAMRTLWSGLVPDQELRQAAFALDAVAIDIAFIFGPLIAAGVIAVWTPAASLGVCVALALTGSEERRVGKECRLLCRSRWSPYH